VYLKFDLTRVCTLHMRAHSNAGTPHVSNQDAHRSSALLGKLAQFGLKQDPMLCYLGPVILYLISTIYMHIGRA
jgi:hypothetical protein